MDEDDAMSDNSVPFGYGASAYGSEAEEEDDDFVLHRPVSLQQMVWESTTERYDVERAASPAPSYLSMHSDDWAPSKSRMGADTECITTRIQLDRQDSSGSSCCSVSSDEGAKTEIKQEKKPEKKPVPEKSPAPLIKPELEKEPIEKRHPALTVKFTFTVLQNSFQKLREDEFKRFKRILWERYPECFRDRLDNLDIIDLVDKMLEVCDLEVSLKITDVTLNYMKLKKLAEQLKGLCKRNKVRYELKRNLKVKYERIYEGLSHQSLFRDVYTDLYITDGGNAAINSEHEFRQIQDLKEDGRGKKKVLSCNNIFDPETVKSRHLRTVITKGSPGIGKSTVVQKFILDWVEGTSHQDIFFLLPLPFKELNHIAEGLKEEKKSSVPMTEGLTERVDDLNQMEVDSDQRDEGTNQRKESTIGFMDLICRLYPEMKEVDNLDVEDCQVMFILDGLDSWDVPIDFRSTAYWCDHNEPAPLKVLLTNLIRGNLLFSAYVWVITRPITINQVPTECIHQLLEIRGFTNEQREEYFRKTVAQKELAEKIITHIKSCKTLYIMCHMPLFCWVVRKAFEADLPVTLTHLYTNFLLVQTGMCGQRQLKSEFLIKLGNMAFQLLEKNVFKIEKQHWQECGLDPQYAVVAAGLCTQFYREKFMMYQEKVDCFIHPTMQEYLAALYVFHCFKNLKKNILEGSKPRMFSGLKEASLESLHKSAVDKTIQAQNGSYVLFLHFLLGMSVEVNQNLLSSVLSNTISSEQARQATAHYIKSMIEENRHPESNNYLRRCLNELLL